MEKLITQTYSFCVSRNMFLSNEDKEPFSFRFWSSIERNEYWVDIKIPSQFVNPWLLVSS